MKMVVAYVDRELFEPLREELLDLGFLSLSVLDASGSVPEPTVTGHYRGTAIEHHLRPKARLECVVGSDEVRTVIDTVLKHGGPRTFAFVVPVDQAHPTESVKGEGIALEAH
jgi:nitrogen regulatory protein PII